MPLHGHSPMNPTWQKQFAWPRFSFPCTWPWESLEIKSCWSVNWQSSSTALNHEAPSLCWFTHPCWTDFTEWTLWALVILDGDLLLHWPPLYMGTSSCTGLLTARADSPGCPGRARSQLNLEHLRDQKTRAGFLLGVAPGLLLSSAPQSSPLLDVLAVLVHVYVLATGIKDK